MLDRFAMQAIFAMAIASVGSEAESFDTANGAPQSKDSSRNPSCIGSASSSWPLFSVYVANDGQNREGGGDVTSASLSTLCQQK